MSPLTRQEAMMQANLLRLYDNLPDALARVVWRTVANPQAGPDTLLILADAIGSGAGTSYPRIAAAIADLAPTRANPIKDAH